MGKVVFLSTKKIPPKREVFEHAGQKYVCEYDPNAPPDKRWVWTVPFVRTYNYYGSSASLETASVAARKRIHLLNKRVMGWEESQ